MSFLDPTSELPPYIQGSYVGFASVPPNGTVLPVAAATPESESASKWTIFNNLLQFGAHITDSLLQAKLYKDSLAAQQKYGQQQFAYDPNTGKYQQNVLAEIPMIVWIVLAAVLGVLIWKKG